MGIRLHKDWAYYALFQYFWILVILPKAVQLLALGALMCVMWLKSGSEKPLDKFTLLQLFFIFIYGVSILINAIVGDHAPDRSAAALNTWSISLVALLLYHLYRNTSLDYRRLQKYSLINLVVLILIWIVFKVMQEPTFSIFNHCISAPDFVNGVPTLRFLGFLDYSNLIVFCILFFYPMALAFLERRTLLSGIITAVLFLVIYDTNSRTGLVLYLIVLLAYALFGFQKSFFYYYRERKFALLAITVLAVVIMAGLLANQIIQILQSLIGMREGSNSMRFYIYKTSLNIMLTQSPIIGVGIKDMLGDYPLGSHSTYIGVFYKAGILGGSLYLISIIGIAIKKLLFKDTDRYSSVSKLCMLAVLLLMVFEDVDGANWCVCIFYILLALIENKQTVLKINTSHTEDQL